MIDEWGALAADWDADAGPRAYASAAVASLEEALERRGRTLDGAAVLDFGCGTGLLVERFVDRVGRVDAVDPSPGMRAVLEAKVGRSSWDRVRVLAELPDAAGPYDLVVCSSVLGFVDDLAEVVGRLATELAPGGLLIQWDWQRTDDEGDDHGLTRDEIARSLAGAGLVDVEVSDGFTVEVDGQVMQPLRGVASAPRAAAAPQRPAR